MDEDDSYKYYPFPNISLEENRGKRYPVPQLPEEFFTWQEWMQSEVKKNKICSEEVMNATNNEKLVPISSPDENKKDTYVFGLGEIEYSYLHAIKEHEGYNYLYRVYLQYLRDEMSQGNRSPRVLRVASHIDEEEQTEKMWTEFANKICNELIEFLQEIPIEGYVYYDIFKLDETCQLMEQFVSGLYGNSTMLEEISKQTVKIILTHSQDRKPNLKALYSDWKIAQLREFFDEHPAKNNQIDSSEFKSKKELVSYMVENNLTPENFENSPNSRCGPLTVLIDDLSNFIEKIIKSKIRQLDDWNATTLMGNVAKSTKKIFQQKEPKFHSKNISGNDNNPTKIWSLEKRVSRASELLTSEIIKILICDLKWLSIRKPDDIDLEHWRKILGIEDKKRTANKEPNIYVLTKKFLEIPYVGGSEVRKRNKSSYDYEKHKHEQHSIFRHMVQNPKQWMYCEPVNHNPKQPGGYIKSDLRKSINKSAVMDKLTELKVKYQGEKWSDNYPKRSVIGTKVCESLNNLQRTQWEINTDFLSYITEGFKITRHEVLRPKYGGTDNNIIKLKSFMDEILNFNEEEFSLPEYRVKEIKDELQFKRNLIQSTLKSCFKIFRNSDNVFWHRWSVDYRGRLYPANMLSPHGSDFNKALIRFKEWLPLGESGWRWFKIHTCNMLSGLDLHNFFKEKGMDWERPDRQNKLPFNSREKWTNEHIDCILYLKETLEDKETQTALELTLEGILKPKSEVFQRISVIIEFARVYEEFKQSQDWNLVKSGLPIHLDASCNGFQHAAALLENEKLARLVNILEPLNVGASANDLYAEIANQAELMFRTNKNSKLRKYLIDNQDTLGISEDDIELFGQIFTRNLVKRPTISIGYGAGSKSENFFGLVSLKDNTSPPRDRYKIQDWEYYRKSVRKKVIVDCPVCSRKKFKDEDSLVEHLLKVHTVAVWHMESPLFKSIQPNLQAKIAMREWPSVIQIEIAKWITEDIATAVQTVTNKSFEKLGNRRLRNIQSFLLGSPKNMDKRQLQALCKKFKIQHPDKEIDDEKITKKELVRLVRMYSNKIKRSFICWDVTDEDGIRIVNFQPEPDRAQINNKNTKSVNDVFLRAYNLLHPDNKVDKVEDVFTEYGIDIDGKSDYNARLAQIFLSNMSRSESYTDEFNKIMKNLFEIGFTLRVKRLNKSEIKYKDLLKSITPNFIQSLDACHMRNTINSMSERGIKDFWSVHDSFGTHACNVELMKKTVIEEFVNLHRGRNIEYWCNHMLDNWEEIRDPELELPSNDLDYHSVSKSEFMIG